MNLAMRTGVISIAVIACVLPYCRAQKYVERDFAGGCEQTEAMAKAYLNSRGFTEPECPNCPHKPNSLKSPKELLDAQGKTVGTLWIRRDLAGIKTPFWLWSSPLHARVFLSTKAQAAGCRLGLWIDFYSLHTMVAVIFPAGERLGLPSNGKLESGYLDAIEAQVQAGTVKARSVPDPRKIGLPLKRIEPSQ
jgi:hypothetical protein